MGSSRFLFRFVVQHREGMGADGHLFARSSQWKPAAPAAVEIRDDPHKALRLPLFRESPEAKAQTVSNARGMRGWKRGRVESGQANVGQVSYRASFSTLHVQGIDRFNA